MVRASLAASARKTASNFIASSKGVYHSNHLERANHLAAKKRIRKRRDEEVETAAPPPRSFPKSQWKGAYDVMTQAREQADVDDLQRTLLHLDDMQHGGAEANDGALFVYISLLRKCVERGLVREGEAIHAHMVKNGHATDRVVAHLVMQLYCGSRMPDKVHSVFASIAFKNSTSYGLMITSYAQAGEYKRALDLFKAMMVDEEADGASKPDANVLATALFCCASLRALDEGKAIHQQIRESKMNLELVLENALLNMYAKCGDLEAAKDVFRYMSSRNAVSWGVMVSCYLDAGQTREGLKLFKRMVHEPDGLRPAGSTFVAALGGCAQLRDVELGREFFKCGVEQHKKESDVAVMTAGINMFSKCGCVDEARGAFDRMKRRDVVAWNAMLSAYAQNGHLEEAFFLYDNMLAEPGVEADGFTFATMLGATEGLDQGRKVHATLASSGVIPDVVVFNSLVSMYGRCGAPAEARKVFDEMENRDVVSWTAMISAYTSNCQAKEAIELYKQMDVEPNAVTFVAVLNACSAAGDLELGKQVDGRASRSEYKENMQLQNAVMNMYGRCGQVHYARWEFDRLMTSRDTVSWNTMLSTYAQHGHTDKALELFPGMHLEGVQADGVTFLALLGCCSHAGLLKECREKFRSMVDDFWVEPTAEHYGCLIDLLARSGKLGDAEGLVRAMPVEPGPEQWTSLLAASKSQGDSGTGKRSAVQAAGLEPGEIQSYVLLADTILTTG